MKQFLVGLLLGVIAIPMFAFLYILLGYAPVATAAPPFPLERKIAQMALHARIKGEAPAAAPLPPTPDNLAAGARLYREHCAVCHGAGTTPRTATAAGMYPPPPQLLHGKGVTDDPVGETYWKVANGIRLTGMPAYGKSLSENEMWEIAQVLANADHLPPEAQSILATEPPSK